MASVTSQLIEEVTAHAQSDSLEDAREVCADGTYFPNKTLKSNKRYSSPVTGPELPRGFQEVKVPRFRDNGTGWW